MAQSDSHAIGLSSNLDTEVGRVVVETGLATKTEIDFCREQQKQSSDPNHRSLADLLVENAFITINQAKRIRSQLDERRSSAIPGYQILGVLGKGAMAKVVMARQISLDRIVAIKVLPRKMSDNVEFIERFYKEGKAAAKLSHNNIVQAIDVGTTPDNLHFFVMEYVEGKTLYDIMQPPPVGEGKTTYSEAEVLDIAIQIGDALAHAHKRGLIHRDVKPKNIILTPQGVAKLTDLGLARATDDKIAAESEAGKAYGTPYYISPEQIRGEVDIDFRADIYSLGCTMYHMVTGKTPFEGETPSGVMHKHLKQPLIPPDHINTALSAGISEIIETCMAKNRDERYASTEDLLEDLWAVRRGEPPIQARKALDIDQLAKIEETATNTIDIEPTEEDQPQVVRPYLWNQPLVIALIAIAGFSIVANLILIVITFTR
ncbi:MAG TPA: serine/threonine-protein kinase [Tepidisphaeraceae bacterium]|nr:serine/threonine-protein kinase [Tepidisphaeraceae bacterium]